MQLSKQIISFPNYLNISFLFNSKNKNLLIFKNTKLKSSFFIQVPNLVKIVFLKENSLQFFSNDAFVLNNFVKFLNKTLNVLKFPFFVKLFLKGLGFRMKLVELNLENFLELKLGYSNLIFIKVPKNFVNITIKKTSLILSGFLKSEIGNFANRIYNLRKPNKYTGKGFRFKKQRLQLKDIKKT
jgi:ribosomal protein L6P/L9E